MSADLYKWEVLRDEKEDELEREKIDRFLVFGLALTLLIVPIISRLYINSNFVSPVLTDGDILSTGSKTDIFTAYKYFFLVTSTIILLLLFLYKVFILRYSIPSNLLYVFLAVFALSIALSVVFAPYKMLALHGTYNRHDGAITYLCYISLFFIAANIKYDLKMLKSILYALYPFVLINVSLGLLNFYGYDVLKWSWVKSLLYSSLPDGLELTEGSRFITTVNHGNYISGASAVLITLFFVWALLDQNRVRSIFHLFVALASFSMLLSSLSVSGFLTTLVIFPIILLIGTRYATKKQFITYVLVFIISSSFIYTAMTKHNPKVWDETFGFFIKSNPFAEARTVVNELQKAFDASHVYAETGSNQENQEYQLPELPKPGVGPGSGRLYIWKKTLELIQQRPLFGYGLDTLAYFFPQDDPEKQANIETYKVIVDKPHNMYIGIAYGAGVIALFAFVAFIFNIALSMMKRLITIKLVDDQQAIFVSIALACCAYLIQALFNDSIIGTAVIFWILLGLLVSFLMQNKQEKVG
ncbi:O-antigen ligase family protein [Parageobacillus thermoglucosidasius]|uniref:O-antigen ligase family protein n=1 Tax=Parageobacillus thermoglucosidasius TaxID=1426 RepID=UPI0001D16E25|nr:O-antigen ligase family protein [Parageobacillus thermoglucosidasius]AEH46342.1 O-antigen polymerase [Parageobacillus thermoglucosidasius C56-YS93]